MFSFAMIVKLLISILEFIAKSSRELLKSSARSSDGSESDMMKYIDMASDGAALSTIIVK